MHLMRFVVVSFIIVGTGGNSNSECDMNLITKYIGRISSLLRRAVKCYFFNLTDFISI